MNVNTILQPTWPVKPGQSLLEATSLRHQSALRRKLFTWEKKRFLTYEELIEFAKDERFPSVTFTPLAQEGILNLLAVGCNEETRLQIIKRADRAIGLHDVYPWTESIHIMDDGKARIYGCRGVVHSTALRRIRKEYLK